MKAVFPDGDILGKTLTNIVNLSVGCPQLAGDATEVNSIRGKHSKTHEISYLS